MTQVNIEGYEYEVNYIAGLTCDDESDKVDGCIDFTHRRIEIEAGMDAKNRISTVYHEAIHALIRHSGLDEFVDPKIEEAICAMLGRALPKLLTDNPDLVAQVFQSFERFGVLSIIDGTEPRFIGMSKGLPFSDYVLMDDTGEETRIPRSEVERADRSEAEFGGIPESSMARTVDRVADKYDEVLKGYMDHGKNKQWANWMAEMSKAAMTDPASDVDEDDNLPTLEEVQPRHDEYRIVRNGESRCLLIPGNNEVALVNQQAEVVAFLPLAMLDDKRGAHKLRRAIRKWEARQQKAVDETKENNDGNDYP